MIEEEIEDRVKEIEKIMEEEDSNLQNYRGIDTVLEGLLILSKYKGRRIRIIETAYSEQIYSISVEEAVENGITDEDVLKLRDMNWMIDDEYNCFSSFV